MYSTYVSVFSAKNFSLLFSCLYGAIAQVSFTDTTTSEDLSAVQADEDSTLIIEDTAFAGFLGQVCGLERASSIKYRRVCGYER